MIKKIMVLLLSIGLISVISAYGKTETPPAAKEAMEKAGFPLYSGAVFCLGDANTGMRFATKDNPEIVRQWYAQKLSEWSKYTKYGSWILYEGPSGVGMSELMKYNHVDIHENKELPSWHSLPANMTTEILVTLPRATKASSGQPLLTIPAKSTTLDKSSILEIYPAEIIGPMDSSEDFENNRGIYYYIQDENYNEYRLVYESDLPLELQYKLQTIGPTYDKVKVTGDIIKLKDETILGFDRNKKIDIFPVE